ncbi:Rv1733c family protein [Streptomyces antimicrobicus]|uniref:Integral membrane protein n=1 Tax=Streptomyces antimicrobicus TaxID=2883108 RepID=A0ABS8B8B9_9ACTN|nr:hypothetical protein [Streptomyces antimicrobicus]MCB5180857.1 hypothetical protein [Streptomyces antimicrobicus]
MKDRTSGRGANPLRRKADRTRTRLRLAFAVACLVAVFCGVAAGRASWTGSSRAAESIARHRHEVSAVTVGETFYLAGARPRGAPADVARATWHYPLDRSHTDTVPVPRGTRAGDTVRVWVDDAGHEASAPPGTADVALDAFGVGAGALTGVLLVSGLLVRGGLRLVDARSSRAWETEWESVEPLWSGRLRPGHGAGDG